MVELATVLSVAGFPARHGFSTVALGSMGLTGAADPEGVIQRRRQLAEQVGFDLDRALMTVQEHGANVATFHRALPEGGQCVFSTDALATDVPGQAIVTYHADCFPLLFVDVSRGVVAGAHAGWRGTLAGVATKTAQALQTGYGSWPGQIDVLIGPVFAGAATRSAMMSGSSFRRAMAGRIGTWRRTAATSGSTSRPCFGFSSKTPGSRLIGSTAPAGVRANRTGGSPIEAAARGASSPLWLRRDRCLNRWKPTSAVSGRRSPLVPNVPGAIRLRWCWSR